MTENQKNVKSHIDKAVNELWKAHQTALFTDVAPGIAEKIKRQIEEVETIEIFVSYD